MGTRAYWDRMLVYFGIAEETDDAVAPRSRTAGRRHDESVLDDEWEVAPEPTRTRSSRSSSSSARSGGAPRRSTAGMGMVAPRTFNDAQSVADYVKAGQPVILNLQQTDSELAKRLIDFASGLTYGLSGDIKRIADKVFLLLPPNVEVTDEERAQLVENGFFNQS